MNTSVQDLMGERTLVLLKPDAVIRGLMGEILQRFERACLKVVALKMLEATREQLDRHFPQDNAWVEGLGEKTLSTYREYGIDPAATFGTSDPREIGTQIKLWNYDYLLMGPLVALIVEGVHAVDVVRKMVGDTLPYRAQPGTIRGDYSIISPVLANLAQAAVKNLVHASATREEATTEIDCWFGGERPLSYLRSEEAVAFLAGGKYPLAQSSTMKGDSDEHTATA